MAIGYYIASVKISKQDVTGDDISSNISRLLRFTLNYSDITPITFEVLSKVEYPTYFQFQIKFQGYGGVNTLAYSADNYMRDYRVQSQRNTSQTGSILIYDGVSSLNSLGYFNPSSGEYTLGYTPNTIIYITASAAIKSNVGASDAQLIFAKQLSIGNYQTILSTSPTAVTSTPTNFSLQGPFYPVKGETYVTYIASSTTSDFTSSQANFYINQNQPPTFGVSGSGNDTILYITGDSNENPLYGNAFDVAENPHYSKVDYIEYVLPEKDFELILSGSGTKSNVKQYNYELLRSVLPRYKGSRTVSEGFNLNTLPPNPSQNVYSGVGVKPNVERTTPYFLYFNKIINTAPILKDKTTLELKYLIDENGEAYNLNTQVPIYQNLIGSFEVGKKAYASFLNNANTIYNNTQSILLSGQYYEPILYSLSSSVGLSWSPTLNFLNLDGSSGSGALNFNSVVSTPSDIDWRYSTPNTTADLTSFGSLNGTQTYSNGNWNTSGSGGSTLPVTSNTFHFEQSATTPVTVTIYGGTYTGAGIGFNFLVRIYKNSQQVASQQSSTNADQSGTYSATYTFIPQAGDYIQFSFLKLSNSDAYSQIIYPPTVSILTSGLTIPNVSTHFWYLSPSNSSVITASADLTDCYQQYIQVPISSSGFRDSGKIFDILPGDEFRFEYQEGQNNVFTVVKAEVTSSATFAPQRLYVTFDKPIPTTSPGNTGDMNLDHFTIRRKSIDVGNGVTLDAPFTTNASGGFLFPEFPTDKIKNNLPTIVSNLQQKGLI